MKVLKKFFLFFLITFICNANANVDYWNHDLLYQDSWFIESDKGKITFEWHNKRLASDDFNKKTLASLYAKSFAPVYVHETLVTEKIETHLFDEWNAMWTEDVIKEWNDDLNLKCVVAKLDNRVIGFALFFDDFAKEYLSNGLDDGYVNRNGVLGKNDTYLAYLVVDPEYQKLGVGKELSFSILGRCPETERIVIYADVNNKNACDAYFHMGFSSYHEKKLEYNKSKTHVLRWVNPKKKEIIKKYEVYFAGDLFDHKHITGNLLLAKKIQELSEGLYQCILPQDWEGELENEIDIRNADIKAVVKSDLVILNFDGTDLDSGTVVEFVIAKMLDIPVVLLRTDTRNGGHFFGADWNLMVAGYPRCISVKYPALLMYHDIGLEKTHCKIAQSTISALERVLKEKSILKSYEEVLLAYQYVIKMCGAGLDKVISLDVLHKIISSKMEKNIYSKSDCKWCR